MKYYKLDGDVYAFESDGSQDYFIKPDMVLMSQAEIDEHLKVDVLTAEQQLRPLTRRQFKLALLHAGLTEQIKQSIASIDEPTTKAVIEIEYNEATEFHRLSDSVTYMCSLLSLTSDEINTLWETALTYQTYKNSKPLF